ncbi:porin [Paraburkholderia xenovorans]|uniref:porin n=1 Tax=Paraburkholderia xenovorans TaxID=36873 RepID=UPI0038BD7BD1
MRSRIVFFVLSIVSSATPVFANAQSSVTLYGLIDTGIQYVSGMPKGHEVGMYSGHYYPSRWGIRGSEDLGGGTRVIFQLESGFNSINGSMSSCGIFCRRATVGVANQSYGTVKIGRIGADEVQNYSAEVDPQWSNEYSLTTLVRGRNWTLASNSLEYTSPKWMGITLKGQYELTNSTTWNSGSPGTGAGENSAAQGRSDGLSVTYEGGPIYLLAIYDEIRDSNGMFSNVYSNSRSVLAGGKYFLGPVTLVAGYQHLSAPEATANAYFASTAPSAPPPGATVPTAVNQEWLGATWNVTPVSTLLLGWYHADANHGNGNANLWTLGGEYHLSKRTFLYSEIGLVTNSKTSNIGLGDGFTDPYGANENNAPASGSTNYRTSPNFGGSQRGAFIGMVSHF